MGAELSVSLNKMPDNTTIFQKTSNTIETMNRILDFLLMNSDVRDMISLGDTEKCKKWLIFGEDKLKEVFDKVKISPDVKEGTLFIKKLDVLIKGQDSTSKEGCRLLAFFFIRLFQVVGALSLSIMDTRLPENDYQAQPTLDIQQEKNRIPLLKIKEDKPKSFLGMFKGGTIQLPENLNFLNIHVRYSESDKSLILRYPYIGSTKKLDYYNDPVGYILKADANSLYIEYKSGANNTILFRINKKDNERVIIISDVKRNNQDIRLRTNEYTFGFGDQNIVYIKYKDEDSSRTDDINFTKFIGEQYLIKEIETKPASTIAQLFKKYNYIEKSSDENFYKLRGFNIGSDSKIIISKTDYLNSINPTFEFIVTTDYENKKITLKCSFKIKVLEENDAIQIKIDELQNISNQYKEIPIAFEEDENDENTKPTDSTDPSKRRFTIKSGFGASNQPTFGRTDQTIIQFLQVRFKDIFEKFIKQISEGFVKSKRGILIPPKEGEANELKFIQLWRAVASDPPIKAFCTARALQLLDKSGLYSSITPNTLQFIRSTKLPEKITPHVSNSKFPLIQNRSLPSLGQPITTAEGLAALQTLYNPISEQYVKPTVNSGFFGLFAKNPDADRLKKQDSLEKLILSFRTDENKLSNTISQLSQITDINPRNISSFDPKNNLPKLKALRLQAIKLFQIQFYHTQKVNQLLNKLFKIDNRIELRPDILSKGVNGIEEIAQEARDLLTDYYAGCQTEYIKGVDILSGKVKVVVNSSTTNTNTNIK